MERQQLLMTVAAACALTLSGCTVGPDYVQPEVETVPDAWNTAATKGLAEGEASIQTWWTVFDDATLTSLIERSRTSNLTLREAVWRVEEARSLRGVVAGVRAPQVGLDGNAAGPFHPSSSRHRISSISESPRRGRSTSGAGSAARSRPLTPRSRPQSRTFATYW
jgi:outer membrane protein TolC